jgi:hypothetical protein
LNALLQSGDVDDNKGGSSSSHGGDGLMLATGSLDSGDGSADV